MADFTRVLLRSIKEPFTGLTLWLAILAILATIHADVFEQTENPLMALFERPFTRILAAEPSVIDLSTIVPTESRASTAAKPLYIFVLDLSQSMTKQRLSELEIGRYRKANQSTSAPKPSSCELQADSEADHPGAQITGFHIARLQLCRYISSLPENSLAALWSFGSTPVLAVPDEDTLGSKYIEILITDNGGDTKKQLIKALYDLDPVDDQSDFESLLSTLADRYQKEISIGREVHVVIASDFVHDIGGGKILDSKGEEHTVERSLWQSRYRISAFLIADLFRQLSRPETTFHLAAVHGAQQVFCSVLPIAQDTIEWSAYREIRLQPEELKHDFDFLRAYEEVATPITFYYTPGSQRPLSTRIHIDDPRFTNTRLRVTLAADTRFSQRYPLNIKVRFKNAEEGVARIGRGHVGRLERRGDQIALEPLSTLTAREAGTYRLLFSWDGQLLPGKPEVSPKTYAASIVFQKRLSLYGAIAMVVAMTLTLIFILWMVGVTVRMLWQRARHLKADPEPAGA